MKAVMEKHRPLIAILRGVELDEVQDVAEHIIGAGITVLEVTMNSPQPFKSIEKLATVIGDRALIGAGTVTQPAEVDAIHDLGGRIVISPHTNPDIIRRTKDYGMISCPGCQTVTECYSALKAGADILKLFPASAIGPEGLKAIRATLPPDAQIYAVGGVEDGNMSEYAKAGAKGFGIGSALFTPGKSLDAITQSAERFVKAWDAIAP